MPKLSEQARHVVVPPGVTSTGWLAVEARARDFGVTFQPWQDGAGRVILAKRADGKYAATIGGTGLSIPRQVGKTFLLGAIVFALALLYPGLTIIWTAHLIRTGEETFGKMQAFARRSKIVPYIDKIILGSGEEEIRFTNGSRILFGSRKAGFGRGFDEVDVLIFDEAQHLDEAALDDMIPATNQSRQPTGALVLFAGTPPKPSDRGEVFTRMRTEVLSGEDEDTSWIEFGADPDFLPTPLPGRLTEADWEQIAKANPSFPASTPREAILRMRKKLGPDSFVREGLGIWDSIAERPDIFGPGLWKACERPFDASVPLAAIGVAATPDLKVAAIVGAGNLDDGVTQVRPLRRNTGLGWVVKACQDLHARHGCVVVIDDKGPAAMLVPVLEQAGLPVVKPSGAEFYQAHASTLEAVRSERLAHAGYPQLDAEVAGAVMRGGDKTALERRKANVELVEAMFLAVWQLTRVAPPVKRSAYESRGVIMI